MARYYTLSESTPAWFRNASGSWVRVYPNAPSGFLFHDTENTVTVRSVLRPLHRLAELFEGAKHAYTLVVDEHTLFAGFSMRFMPYPVIKNDRYHVPQHLRGKEWLSETKPKGWIVRNVHDPSKEPIITNYDDIYDTCTRLERFSDACPCPRMYTKDCLKEVVLPVLGEDFDAESMDTDYGVLDTAQLRRKKYEVLSGFEYISGKHTTRNDFDNSVRPWDDYDFTLVEQRKKELSDRGKKTGETRKFRREVCANCIFSQKYGKEVEDCGRIASCQRAVDENTAWQAVYNWHEDCGIRDNSEFTDEQIHYLITEMGKEYFCKALTLTRRTDVVMAGFIPHYVWKDGAYETQWHYGVAAAKGDLSRSAQFATYAELKKVMPDIAPINAIPTRDVPERLIIATEALGQYPTWGSGFTTRCRHHLEYRNQSITVYTATTRDTGAARNLHLADSVADYYRFALRSDFAEAYHHARIKE